MVDDYTWSASRCPLWVISGHGDNATGCPLYPRKRTFGFAINVSSRPVVSQCSWFVLAVK